MPTATPAPVAAPTLAPATPTAGMGCSVLAAGPTPAAAAGLPAITSSDYVRGPDNASVTLLAYCDLQSKECEGFNLVENLLVKNHPNDLRVVLRPVPVPASKIASLDKSQLSAQAAIAAGNQGKFWEMRDLLVSQYNAWSTLSPATFETWLADHAKVSGLDEAKFAQDLKSQETIQQAQSMYTAATTLGIHVLPTVFINGSLQGRAALTPDGLDATIGLLALAPRQVKTCPPFRLDPSKQYTAILHTEKGDIVMQLYAEQAPLAVNSFIFLAGKGWFNGVTFYRVVPGSWAITGDPSGTGFGGPGYYFKNEISLQLLFDKPGVVAMFNSGPDTNGSQFFITYAPQIKLDGSYTIFGQVIQGMNVVESLTPRDPATTQGLPPGDKILSVTIQEK
ncbi:MAG TPA: peptidylprolyl isomerase [Anaerolineales bacterium]